ncbi:MAG: cytochrome c oxidase assembly protein [bacterium]
MTIAFAHSGELHPTVVPEVSLLFDWGADPVFLPLLLAAWLYLRGLRAYRAKGGTRFPRWRPWLFLLGVLVAAAALLSPIDLLAEYSFTWHMAQHQLLVLVAPPLLLLGAPFLMVVRGIPPGLRRRVFVPVAKNPLVRAALIHGTRPIVGLLLLQGALWFWHFPAFYDRALGNIWWHYGEHFSFVVGAGLFWWNIVTPFPFPARLNYLLRMLLLFLSSVFNTALGAMLTFADTVLYRYSAVESFWSLPMLVEQTMGAALMWVVGAMMHLVAILAVFAVYAHRENRKEPPRALYLSRRPAAGE